MKPDAAPIAAELDAGEFDAILLAEELGASELILDDMDGRKEAERRHIHSVGTLGVLQAAARRGLLNLKDALTRLRATNFYVAQELIDRLIAEANQMSGQYIMPAAVCFRADLAGCTDAASQRATLREVTRKITTTLEAINPYETWGLIPYFNFRSESEQATRNDPEWA